MTAANLALQPRAVDAKRVATATVDQRFAHDRSPQLSHHFDTMSQQYEAAKLGMWLFLATEVLLFGGLFCLYAVLRGVHPEIFDYGSQFLDIGWGTINTAVLIISSLTMAMAVWCAQSGHQRGLVVFLALTLVCATDFLGVKIIEYSHKFHDNLVWGVRFYEDPHEANGQQPVAEPPLEDVIELQAGARHPGKEDSRSRIRRATTTSSTRSSSRSSKGSLSTQAWRPRRPGRVWPRTRVFGRPSTPSRLRPAGSRSPGRRSSPCRRRF